MHLKKHLLFYSILFLSVQPSFAGGFQVNLQGQKQTGMGHTGVGLLSDASSVYFNCGSSTFLKSKYSFAFGGSLIMPSVTYSAPSPSLYETGIVKNFGTPFSFYYTQKVDKNEKLSLGLGIYTPFGSRQQYPDDWMGQFIIREINLKTIFVQPTAAYQINDKLGIGVGFIYAFGNFSLRKGIPIQDVTESFGEGNLSGKASGIGVNTGIYFKPDSTWSFGLTYRTSVKTSIENGNAEFAVPASLLEYFPKTTFSSGIKLPSMLSFGVGYTSQHSGLRFAFDVNYVGWSSYDSLVIDFNENTEKLADIHSPRLYENSFIFRIGGEYNWNDAYSFRLGAYYDLTPVQDGYLTPETPDNNKLGITTGFSYMINMKMKLDISFLYINAKERYDQNLETEFAGTYKSHAIIPGIGFSLYL